MIEEKVIFRTWDNHCLFKLQEIGKSTLRKWATAMEYDNPSSMISVLKRLTKANKLNIKELTSKKDWTYEVKEDVVFKE